MPAGLVGPGDPPGAFDHPRVEQVPDGGRLVGAERRGAEVTADQAGVLAEVVLGEGLDDRRVHDRRQPLGVDVAVAGNADGEQLGLSTRLCEA